MKSFAFAGLAMLIAVTAVNCGKEALTSPSSVGGNPGSPGTGNPNSNPNPNPNVPVPEQPPTLPGPPGTGTGEPPGKPCADLWRDYERYGCPDPDMGDKPCWGKPWPKPTCTPKPEPKPEPSCAPSPDP